MRCARINQRRSPPGSAFRQWHLGLTLLLLFLAHAILVMPAAAQEAPAAGAGGAVAPAAGGPQAQPALPGVGPDILPPPPGGGFGFPNPLIPPNAVNNAGTPLVPAAPANPLGLAPLGNGVVPLQQFDSNAPAILIGPRASVSETLTDNVNYAHSPRDAAAYTNLAPGLSISADTPRLQAVLSGNLNAYIYTPSSSTSTSNLDQVFGSLYANGFGTIVPDALFVNLQSLVTQTTPLPGSGFQNLSQLPTNQQTQVYSNNISPFLRKSFDGLVDSKLRYPFSSTNFGGNTTVATSPIVGTLPITATPTSVSSGIL